MYSFLVQETSNGRIQLNVLFVIFIRCLAILPYELCVGLNSRPPSMAEVTYSTIGSTQFQSAEKISSRGHSYAELNGMDDPFYERCFTIFMYQIQYWILLIATVHIIETNLSPKSPFYISLYTLLKESH